MRKLNVGILALALMAGAAFTVQAQTTEPAQPFVVGGHIEIVNGEMIAVGGKMVADVDKALPTRITLKKGAVLNFARKQPTVGTNVTVKALPPKTQAFCLCKTTQAVASDDPAGYHVILAVKGDTPGIETFEITHTVPGPSAEPSVTSVEVEVVK